MVTVSLRYWAGAKAAAGVASESIEAVTVAEALEAAVAARDDGRLAAALPACSLLIDGLRAQQGDLTRPLTDSVTVEVLPPFAGGAGCGAIDPAASVAGPQGAMP